MAGDLTVLAASPRSYWRLLRPQDWIKNILVLFGLLFGFAWATPEIVEAVAQVFLAFCLASSAVYILNDIIDLEADRAHPKKCLRPIAAGEVGVPSAAILGCLLATGALTIAWQVGSHALLVVLAYLLLNIAYSLRLKHVILLDVFGIALGFQLRLLAGTAAVGLAPSRWLLLTGMMVTLFLGFAKRRAELMAGNGGRKVLEYYSATLLDKYLSGTGIGAAICYGLYTVDAETVAKHHTDALIYTVPFVLFGIYRYLYLLHQHSLGEDPSRDLLRDSQMVATAILWVAAVAGILYLTPGLA